MKLAGHLRKMRVSLESPVTYTLLVDNEAETLNPHVGKRLRMAYSGDIHCLACGRKTSKSYSQGHCYPCSQSLASCDLCIMKPETCHYAAGTCREPQWGEQNCMQAHYVYLANSSGIKVGITRAPQIPTRWIDQGASQALPIFRVSHRYLSGLVEVAMKDHVSDRTDWRRMLKGAPEAVDLAAQRDALFTQTRDAVQALASRFDDNAIEWLDNAPIVEIDYPVHAYPDKVRSLNFDKTPLIEGTLQGIKGQYLLLDTGVLNIRKFAGYYVEVELD
ncbi:DUF2797 domain-containing protein [Sulfuriflexus mobilis]|uniref:DUF2797 domain-containing protein n=1 Tax=Sulfuriflexus mobilis TaxID=1811807 RepID=UPI0018D520EF|nr:DUF2797 domain-containing protein [Sulfuriflexus mobilis]